MSLSRRVPCSLRIKSHQIELHALDYGNAGARPMVLLHGMRDLAWSLDSVAQAFCDRYRVISLDLRGHGDSAHVGYYAMSHFLIDVRQTLRALELEAPVLVGHSFGGEVVTQYAGLFPEVPAACVLIEGLGPPPWEGEGSREAGLFWSRSAIEALDSMEPKGKLLPDLEAAVARIRRNHPRIDPDRARFLAERGTYLEPAGGRRWKWDPFLRTSWGSFNFGQIELCWRRIACPVLAVNGGASGAFWERDMESARRGGRGGYLPPDEFERRLGCFKDIECVEIPEAGHMVHFDEPEALNRAIAAFLERRRLG
jgi:pimeloyl-ACP methyl ester carboxylesterase